MVKFDLACLTNALNDVIVDVEEGELEGLGLKKATYYGFSKVDKQLFGELLSRKEKHYCPAGSPANIAFNASRLGLKTALLGSLGDDEIADDYICKLQDSGIMPFFDRWADASGVCYILVTPDGERTPVCDMGVAGKFGFDFSGLETKIFHTSGYELITNPARVENVIDKLKERGSRISFDLAAEKAVTKERDSLERIVRKTDILFMTEEEAQALTGLAPEEALREMSRTCPIVALKKGSRGSVVKSGDEEHVIDIYPVRLVNTCGAGDAYASGFLFAHLKGLPLEECGCMGSYVASRVCGMKTSHL